ncbi:beta-1,3-galactosyltransferase 4-like [Cherax quadricarinatus]|uniref:beta-1,3-galactosyltransferase 4-like n=1 Tax=Cherax quadricarinatus TaxID=27406 RepID=UPI00387E2E06
MVRRPLVWLEAAAAVVTAAALFLVVGFTWEASQSALPPPPTAHHHRPPLRAHPELYPPPAPLLDLPAVSLLANSPACGTRPLLLVLLVMSHPSHAFLRHAHRNHASWHALDALGVKRVFFLADGSRGGQAGYPAVPLDVIMRESAQYRDLVVADFQDHYRNLTYKHTLALSWAPSFCPSARYLLKMDDDIMVDVWGMVALLRAGVWIDRWGTVQTGSGGALRLQSRDPWTAGLVQRGLRPQRSSGKWQVKPQEYPGSVYPNFLAGWAYIATQPAAAAIVSAAATTPPFWIDDVYLTGTVAAAAGIPRYALNQHYTLLRGAATCCLAAPRRMRHPPFFPAALCGLLVAPSDKNVTILEAWFRAARACHVGVGCPTPTPDSCTQTYPHYGVGTVIPLS